MRNHTITSVAVATLMVATAIGCSSQKNITDVKDTADTSHNESSMIPIPAEPLLPSSPGVAALPKACIYKTSAPSDSLVPVTVTAGKLVSYPAPTDLTTPPAKLADGWLLDTRGINPDSRFTHWTYAEYKAMKSAPDMSAIMNAIIPGIEVTEIATLPCYVGEATPEMADSLIADGLRGCTITFKR